MLSRPCSISTMASGNLPWARKIDASRAYSSSGRTDETVACSRPARRDRHGQRRNRTSLVALVVADDSEIGVYYGS
jgi:hypothetical protein